MKSTLLARLLALFFIVFLTTPIAWGDLLLWTPEGRGVTYVLPGTISPQAYLQAMEKEESLKPFVQDLVYRDGDSLIRVSEKNGFPTRDQVLVVTNWAQDLSSNPSRLQRFLKLFSSSDINSFALPVGAALRLKGASEKDFFNELTRHFDLFVFIGGDDKAPGLYGEKNTFSVNTNRLRDILEQRLIRHVYYESQKRIFGVCRGLQQVFTSLGGKLIQDIPKETSIREAHAGRVFHEIQLLKTQNGNVKRWMGKLSQKQVLSHHHQMADPKSIPGTPFEVAGVSPEGSIEALESRDNRIVLVQFHPELEANDSNAIRGFFSNLKSWFKSHVQPLGPRSCSKLF